MSKQFSVKWRRVKNHPQYWVSVCGKVLSTKRKKNIYINQRRNEKGYLRVELDNSLYSVHRLVAINFIENSEKKPQVNHIDGDKENNHVSNLEWCTNTENYEHACKLGLNKNHRKPVEQMLNGKIIKVWKSTYETKKGGFSPSLVRSVIRGKDGRTQHKGYQWRYLMEEKCWKK